MKFESFYKIRNKTTKLYYVPAAAYRTRWTKIGKVWNSLGHARMSLRNIAESRTVDMKELEIVEFEVKESKVFSAVS